MDKVEGWKEEEWVGSRFAGCMWIYTEAVLCDGQGPTQEELRRKLSTIMENVCWLCEDDLKNHEWATELSHPEGIRNLVSQNYDIEVCCVM